MIKLAFEAKAYTTEQLCVTPNRQVIIDCSATNLANKSKKSMPPPSDDFHIRLEDNQKGQKLRDFPDHATFREKIVSTDLVGQAWGFPLFDSM